MKVGAFHFFPCHASNSKNVYFTKMKMNNMKYGFSNVLKQTYKKNENRNDRNSAPLKLQAS